MSGHRRVRTQLIVASVVVLVAALATFVVVITVRYRDGLVQRLRTDLTSGASALAEARTQQALKPLIGSLAAEGISVDLAGISSPGGSLQFAPGGALLTVHEVIPIGGTGVPAALTGSLAGIDRQVRSLEVTEASEQPHRELVDLTELASAAVAATRATDPAARVELLTNGPVPVTGDRDALLRALRNLLENAFAVADTLVVAVTHTADSPAVSVSDNGPGVPAEQRERIFEPFVRLPGRPRGGTGLGLAIARRTIESHGGTITCDASSTGGARFTLRLPAEG